MGQNPTKSEQMYGKELRNLTCHQSIESEIFGSLQLAEFTEGGFQKETIIKERNIDSMESGKRLYEHCSHQERINNSCLLQIYGHSIVSNESACGQHTLARIYLEPFGGSLMDEIKRRKDVSRQFREEEIINIIETVAGALSEIKKQEFYHYDINPYSLVHTSSGVYKLYHPLVLSSTKENIAMALTGQKSYISPELLINLKNPNVKEALPADVCDTFSLGLIALEMGTLETNENYYSNKKMQNWVLKKMLSKMAERYPPFLVTLVAQMLSDRESRITIEILMKQIEIYKNQLKNYAIQNNLHPMKPITAEHRAVVHSGIHPSLPDSRSNSMSNSKFIYQGGGFTRRQFENETERTEATMTNLQPTSSIKTSRIQTISLQNTQLKNSSSKNILAPLLKLSSEVPPVNSSTFRMNRSNSVRRIENQFEPEPQFSNQVIEPVISRDASRARVFRRTYSNASINVSSNNSIQGPHRTSRVIGTIPRISQREEVSNRPPLQISRSNSVRRIDHISTLNKPPVMNLHPESAYRPAGNIIRIESRGVTPDSRRVASSFSNNTQNASQRKRFPSVKRSTYEEDTPKNERHDSSVKIRTLAPKLPPKPAPAVLRNPSIEKKNGESEKHNSFERRVLIPSTKVPSLPFKMVELPPPSRTVYRIR